jgi:uncharacterized protein
MSIMSRVLARLFKLPPRGTHQVVVEKGLQVPMRDGAVLLADRYAPRRAGKQPTVLVRGPYGRRGGGLFGRLIAERGYQVLIQSVRGTDGSGGTFDPFRQERDDGLDTLGWVERQAWYSGDLVGLGASYLGFAQWAIAAEAGWRIKAMSVQMAFSSLRDAVYPGGAFALQAFMGWTSLMSRPSTVGTFSRLITGDRKFKRALERLPLGQVDEAMIGHKVPYFQQWLDHDTPDDPWWASAEHADSVAEVTAPVHLLGGWYDCFLPSTVRDYAALRAAGKRPYLTIGPWAHSSFAAMGVAVNEGLAFFDAHVRGDGSRLREEPIRIWVSGAKEWRAYPEFPPPGARPERWYLHAGGRLAPEPPANSAPDAYRYDPADPTPAVGGPLGPGLSVTTGPIDNRGLEARPDVLTYTSVALDRDVEVIGPVSAELFVRSSLEHTDIFVRLCDIHPFGRSINVCDGLLRLAPDRPALEPDGIRNVAIDLWPTAHRFRRGHRIRLQVSSGAFPRWARNLGSGEPLATATTLRVAEQRVYHDPAHGSAVVLSRSG